MQEISPLYSSYDPDEFSEKSARWVYDFVENLLYLRWQEGIKDVRAVRDPLEKSYIEKQPEIEAEALDLLKKDPAAAKKFLTDLTRERMEKLVKTYQDLRIRLITKYTNNKLGI